MCIVKGGSLDATVGYVDSALLAGGVSLPLERITLLFQQLHREPLCGGSLCHIPLGRNQRRNSSTKHGRCYYFQGFHMYGMYIVHLG